MAVGTLEEAKVKEVNGSRPEATKRPSVRTAEGGALAHPLFKRAAERAASSVFESCPEASTAEYKSGEASSPEAASLCVFESTPSTSRADAVSGYAPHTESARKLIEEAAKEAEQNQLRGEEGAGSLAREAEELIQKAVEQSDGGAAAVVFESVPLESVAHARHDTESVCSEEEVTDDEA
ncbi:unnamed protein product [Durusdinium trenchii]